MPRYLAAERRVTEAEENDDWDELEAAEAALALLNVELFGEDDIDDED